MQELNVVLKIAVSPPTQSILHYILETLDFSQGAKSSEKIANPRTPMPVHKFTDAEYALVGDDQIVCKIL